MPYVEQGDPVGVPVLLLHAYLESSRCFDRLLTHLPGQIHAFAVDQRGHGDADRPRTGYDVPQLSADVAAFLDAAGLERVVVVGSSSGGYLAQRFAVDHPGRAWGLVLIGSPRTLRGGAPAFFDAIADLTDPIDPAVARELTSGFVLVQPVPQQFLDLMVTETLKAPAHVWKAALQGLVTAVPPTEQGTISAPTAVIWGERDEFLPRIDQEALVRSIGGAELVVYEDTGHLVLWERPARVAADIVALVQRLT